MTAVRTAFQFFSGDESSYRVASCRVARSRDEPNLDGRSHGAPYRVARVALAELNPCSRVADALRYRLVRQRERGAASSRRGARLTARASLAARQPHVARNRRPRVAPNRLLPVAPSPPPRVA